MSAGRAYPPTSRMRCTCCLSLLRFLSAALPATVLMLLSAAGTWYTVPASAMRGLTTSTGMPRSASYMSASPVASHQMI